MSKALTQLSTSASDYGHVTKQLQQLHQVTTKYDKTKMYDAEFAMNNVPCAQSLGAIYFKPLSSRCKHTNLPGFRRQSSNTQPQIWFRPLLHGWGQALFLLRTTRCGTLFATVAQASRPFLTLIPPWYIRTTPDKRTCRFISILDLLTKTSNAPITAPSDTAAHITSLPHHKLLSGGLSKTLKDGTMITMAARCCGSDHQRILKIFEERWRSKQLQNIQSK